MGRTLATIVDAARRRVLVTVPYARPEAIAVPRIVTAKKTKPAAATTDGGEAVTERKPAQAAAIRGLRIVTVRKPCLQTP